MNSALLDAATEISEGKSRAAAVTVASKTTVPKTEAALLSSDLWWQWREPTRV